jgi:hypothetical protein
MEQLVELMTKEEIVAEIKDRLAAEYYNSASHKEYLRILEAADLAPITLTTAIEMLVRDIDKLIE